MEFSSIPNHPAFSSRPAAETRGSFLDVRRACGLFLPFLVDRRARTSTCAATQRQRWSPALKGVPGTEKPGEWAKLAAEEPDARGVSYTDRPGVCAVPLARPPAHFIFVGQAWAEGKGVPATRRHRADSGRETWINSAPQ